MDNGQNGHTARLDGLVMPRNKKQARRSSDDILTRRLKNRERQRRYRARKRHEADLKMVLSTNQSTALRQHQVATETQSLSLQVEIPVNVTSPDCLARVHCSRDWKKDARRAHVHNKLDGWSNGPINSTSAASGGNLPPLQSCAKEDLALNNGIISAAPILDNNATVKLVPNRRHWKNEARNK